MASTNDTETKNELENQQEIATSLANVHDEFLADLQQIEDEIMNIRPLVVQVSEDSSQIQSQTSNHQNLVIKFLYHLFLPFYPDQGYNQGYRGDIRRLIHCKYRLFSSCIDFHNVCLLWS